MKRQEVVVPVEEIKDWGTFHEVFQRILGFPDFYGQNMNAWIDCLTSIDDPDAGMSSITVEKGNFLTLRINGAENFRKRCPEQYSAIIECSTFVNYRRVDVGQLPAILLLLI